MPNGIPDAPFGKEGALLQMGLKRPERPLQASAFICGCSGTELTAGERAFFSVARPWGLILFSRNVDNPRQVMDLVSAFRQAVGRHAPVFVDQEGGRVQRMGPPHWRRYPAAARYGEIFAGDPSLAFRAARLITWLLAHDLTLLGVNACCLPVLDVPAEGAHDIIGDRAYGRDPLLAAALGRAAMEGLRAAGVAPVIKHLPGHGRARADSHEELPVVNASLEELRGRDFVPFAACADAPMAMTAHVLYAAVDPQNPATLSAKAIGEIIRGELGFSGLLMSDDIGMKALEGSLGERARRALEAGCDVVLHCSGDLEEMHEVARAAGTLEGEALARVRVAEAAMGAPAPGHPDREEAERLLASVLSPGA